MSETTSFLMDDSTEGAMQTLLSADEGVDVLLHAHLAQNLILTKDRRELIALALRTQSSYAQRLADILMLGDVTTND